MRYGAQGLCKVHLEKPHKPPLLKAKQQNPNHLKIPFLGLYFPPSFFPSVVICTFEGFCSFFVLLRQKVPTCLSCALVNDKEATTLFKLMLIRMLSLPLFPHTHTQTHAHAHSHTLLQNGENLS